MIKATVIHGSEAVKEFDRTGKYPSEEWLEQHGCSVSEKAFATEREYQAYCEALEENDGYDDWRIHGVVNTKKTVSAPLDIQLRNLTQQFINKLRMLPLRPEGWLPHVVYVEEEEYYPVYTRYKLEEFQEDGSCVLANHITGERFTDRKLYEINVDWIDTVCSRYFECIIEQDLWKEHALIVLRRECNESDRVIQEFVDSLWQKGRPDDENIALFYEWRYPDEPAFQKKTF